MEIGKSFYYKTGVDFCCSSGSDFFTVWRMVE